MSGAKISFGTALNTEFGDPVEVFSVEGNGLWDGVWDEFFHQLDLLYPAVYRPTSSATPPSYSSFYPYILVDEGIRGVLNPITEGGHYGRGPLSCACDCVCAVLILRRLMFMALDKHPSHRSFRVRAGVPDLSRQKYLPEDPTYAYHLYAVPHVSDLKQSSPLVSNASKIFHPEFVCSITSPLSCLGNEGGSLPFAHF
jgi:hypothetical protein